MTAATSKPSFPSFHVVVQTPSPAARAVMALHAEIAACHPEKHLSRLGLLREVEGYDGDLDSLCLTWDRRHKTLLRREQYEAALHLADASPGTRAHCMGLYQFAARAGCNMMAPVHMPADLYFRNQMAQTILERTPHRSSMPELAFISTESGFMSHLNNLKERSGNGLRPIAAAMHRIDPKNSRAHTTLADMFSSNKVPNNENVVRLLLTVLLSTDTAAEASKELLDDHMRIWRTLIARRTAGDREQEPLGVFVKLLDMAEDHATKPGNRAVNGHFVPGLQLARVLVAEALRAGPDGGSGVAESLSGEHVSRAIAAERLVG